MDNFTHSLVGWALGQTGLKTKSRKGLAALVLGANLPDIDVFFGWVPWLPLATHRGFTHGLLGGVILMPPMLAGLLWLLDRWQVRRGATFDSGLAMHVPWLFALCYIGAITHPLLDLQTSYAIQLLSPFSTRWFHTETLFIIDVWIWTGLAFAIWLSRRREKKDSDWRRPARVALIMLCLYLGLNGAISLMARKTLHDSIPDLRADVLIAGEQPVLFWKRDLVWRRDGMIGQASYDPLKGLFSAQDRLVVLPTMTPDNMGDPLARRAMTANPQVVTFMRWSIMPLAQVRHEQCRAIVTFGDARFGVPTGRSRLTQSVTLPLDRPGCGPASAN